MLTADGDALYGARTQQWFLEACEFFALGPRSLWGCSAALSLFLHSESLPVSLLRSVSLYPFLYFHYSITPVWMIAETATWL